MTNEVYKHGNRLPMKKDWVEVLARSRWAMREAGFKYPRLRFYFYDTLHYADNMGEKRPIDGYCEFNDKSVTIRVVGSKPVTETILHELAHAILSPIENEDCDHHSPVFYTTLGCLTSQYDEEGGPYPDV